MIQRNEADVPEMLTEPGKWLDGDTLIFERTSQIRHHDPVKKDLEVAISIGIFPFNCQSEMVAILGISI